MARLTRAMLLAGAALTAATGCMNVSAEPGTAGAASPAAREPDSGPPPRAEADGTGTDGERVVRSPGQEVLSSLPERERKKKGDPPSGKDDGDRRSGEERVVGTDSRPALPSGWGGTGQRPAQRELPRAGLPQAPAPREQADDSRQGPPERPRVRPRSGDTCAQGERYGRWDPNSQQARICRETYGS